MSDEQQDCAPAADEPQEFVFVEVFGDVPLVRAPEPEPAPPVYPNDRLRMAPNVAWQEVGDEFVLYDSASGRTQVLNATGGLLWQCMEGEGTMEEIFADFGEAFGVPVENVAHDFVPVLAEWKRTKLVLTQDSSAGARSDAIDGAAQAWRYLADPPNR